MREAVNLFFPPLLKLFGGSLKDFRILNVGCNCSGFSFEASKYGPKEIIGIDADVKNIRQANAIKKYLQTKNVNFLKLNAEEVSKKILGSLIANASAPRRRNFVSLQGRRKNWGEKFSPAQVSSFWLCRAKRGNHSGFFSK